MNAKENHYALKALMVLPALLLQKPSAKSKTKDHTACLTRRLEDWKLGNIEKLIQEARAIQKKLCSSRKNRNVEDISRVFAKLMMEGKIKSALKYLDKEGHLLVPVDLNNDVVEELKIKHPSAKPATENNMLNGPVESIPNVIYDTIDETKMFKAALHTEGSAGPSG